MVSQIQPYDQNWAFNDSREVFSKSPDIAADLNEKLSTELSKLSELNRSRAVLVDLLNQHCQLLRCWTEPHRPDKIFFGAGWSMERNT